MSNKKITELTELTTPTTDDVLPLVDIATNATKKAQLGSLPISSATQTALDAKQATLVSGTNIKTINSTSLLGSGDISLTTSAAGSNGQIQFNSSSAFGADSNLFWDNTNKRLGVGTSSPSSSLTIKDPASTDEFRFTPSTNLGTISYEGGSLTIKGAYVYNPQIQLDGTNGIILGRSGSTEWARIDAASGNLGVGVNAPTARTHIKGSGSTAATSSLLVQNSSGTDLMKVSDNGDLTTIDMYARTIYAKASTLELRGNANGSASSARLQGFVSGLGWLSMFTAESGKDFGQIPRGAVVNGTTINSSSIFQIDSTTQGFLPPRMTTTQKNAISSPASGLMVYDTDTNKLCCYNGSTWNDLF